MKNALETRLPMIKKKTGVNHSLLKLATMFVFFICFALSRPAHAQSLHNAACKGDISQIESLLATGEKIDTRDENGLTPLSVGALCGQYNVVKFCIDHGANIESQSNDGSTPLLRAHSENKAGEIAFKSAHLDIVKYLVGKGTNVNATNNFGASFLHLAVDAGDVEMVSFILDKGARVNYPGQSPLIRASGYGYPEIVKLLLDHGADVNSRDKKGQTALMYAAALFDGSKFAKEIVIDSRTVKTRFDYLEVAKLLLDHGAKVDIKSDGGDTALSVANHQEMKKLLENKLEN